MESNGRKKHIVNGNVAEIKKEEEIQEESVGKRKGGFLSGLIKNRSQKEN